MPPPPFAYREYYADAPLDALVRKLWVMDNAANDQPFSNKGVLPNSCFNLAFVTGAGMDVRNRRGPVAMPAGSYFCGQARLSVEVVLRPRTHVTMVQLHPWAPARLTLASLAGTADAIVPLAEVLPALHQGLRAAGPLPHEHAVLAFLAAHLPAFVVAAEQPLLRQACQRWQHTKGTLAVQALAQELACSTRLLEKHFRHAVGLTPKEFAAVLRVRGVVDALQAPSPPPLAQLALEYGFYDQAHFINVFRKMVQLSPGKFVPADYHLPISGPGY